MKKIVSIIIMMLVLTGVFAEDGMILRKATKRTAWKEYTYYYSTNGQKGEYTGVVPFNTHVPVKGFYTVVDAPIAEMKDYYLVGYTCVITNINNEEIEHFDVLQYRTDVGYIDVIVGTEYMFRNQYYGD